MDLHWSFLLIPFVIAWASWQPGSGFNHLALSWYSSVTVLLFAFILLHELGHALAAKSRGVIAERIILFPLGGGAYLPEQPKNLWAEVFVYAAGPLANFLLAGLALPVLLAQTDGDLLLLNYLKPAGNVVLNPTLGQQLLTMTIVVNLLLALGNLLPAYPLDGGRILRALLRRPVGARKATVIVTCMGVIIGTALIFVGWIIGDPLLIVGALFIIGMSVLEYRNGWQRRRLTRYTINKVIRRAPLPAPQRLYRSSTVAAAEAAFAATGWPVLPVFNNWNDLLGFVEEKHLAEDANNRNATLSEYFEAEFVTISPDENLLVTTEKIVDANVYGAAVYGARGKLEGYVFTEDILPLLTPWWRSSNN